MYNLQNNIWNMSSDYSYYPLLVILSSEYETVGFEHTAIFVLFILCPTIQVMQNQNVKC
jgi:hypothetical protein